MLSIAVNLEKYTMKMWRRIYFGLAVAVNILINNIKAASELLI